MKFLVDENIDQGIADFLEKLGYDFILISVASPTIKDYEILDLAFLKDHVVITFDKDFGELVFKEKRLHKGVILLRLRDLRLENTVKALKKVLSTKSKIENYFTVVTEKESGFFVKRRLK